MMFKIGPRFKVLVDLTAEVYDEGIITFASTFTPYWIHIDIMIITL
jgi:hypothetical protein